MEPSNVNIFLQICFFVSWHIQRVLIIYCYNGVDVMFFFTTDHFTDFTYAPELKWPIYRMMAKPIKTLQLHYLINQFLLEHNIRKVLLALDRRFSDF